MSLLDKILDKIIDSTTKKYAADVSRKLTGILEGCRSSHDPQTRYTRSAALALGPMEPAVSTVPRGWLNAGSGGGGGSGARSRMRPTALASDHTGETLDALHKFRGDGGVFPDTGFCASRQRRPVPSIPQRQDSLAVAGTASPALLEELSCVRKRDAWRQCLPFDSAGFSSTMEGNSAGWRSSYQVYFTLQSAV